MADEITFSLRFSATKAGATADSGTVAVVADMAGGDMAGWLTFTATSSAAQLPLPSTISFPANLLIQNLGGQAISLYLDSGATDLFCTLSASSEPPGDSLPSLITSIPSNPYVKTSASTSLGRCLVTES